MSAGDAVQFYAPFAGLMALAFWMGVLSQRVRQLEKDSKPETVSAQLARLDERMGSAERQLGSIDGHLQGVHRQLGNIAMGHVGAVAELPGKK